jgi:SAM-dependent methyltransferase
VLADMTNTGLPGGTLDAAMFLYSLCHVNLQAAMAEAARLLKRDGVLFVFDYVRTGGDNKLSEKYLGAHFRRFDRLLAEIGFRFEDHRIAIPAHGDDTLFRSVFNDPDDPDLYPTIFCDLEPMLWRARRKDWM